MNSNIDCINGCESVINCPIDYECIIDCMYDCHDLVINGQNASGLYVNNCMKNNCYNITIYCPKYVSSDCIIDINGTISNKIEIINNYEQDLINNNLKDVNNDKSNIGYFTNTNNVFVGIISGIITFFLCSCIVCVIPYFCCKIRKLNKLRNNTKLHLEVNDNIISSNITNISNNCRRLDSNDSLETTTMDESVCGSIKFQTSAETNLSSERSPSPFGSVTKITITRVKPSSFTNPVLNNSKTEIIPQSEPNLNLMLLNLPDSMAMATTLSSSSSSTSASESLCDSSINTCSSSSNGNNSIIDYYKECNKHFYKTSECEIVQRMIEIMSKFEQLNIQKQNGVNGILTSDEICNLILKQKYQHTAKGYGSEFNIYYLFIKNDYNHILESHDDNLSFKYIYDQICNKSLNRYNMRSKLCNIDKCGHVISAINNNYNEKKDILILSLFQNMHCYFMHSYDTGMRLNNYQDINNVNIDIDVDIDIENESKYDDKFDEYEQLSSNQLTPNILSPTATYTHKHNYPTNNSPTAQTLNTLNGLNGFHLQSTTNFDTESLKIHVPESRKHISYNTDITTNDGNTMNTSSPIYHDTDVTKLRINLSEIQSEILPEDEDEDEDDDEEEEEKDDDDDDDKDDNDDNDEKYNIIESKILSQISQKQGQNLQQIINRQNRFMSQVIDHEKRISKTTSSNQEIEGGQSGILLSGKSDKNNINNIAHDEVYSFGIRWFYWKKYKNSKYYVSPKYDNLKIELLENYKNSKFFKLSDWNSVYEKSKAHLNSWKGRNLICNSSPLCNQYGIKKKSKMCMEHMISLVIYCNFDKLQFSMKKTFRKIYENESLISIKKRNCKYVNWSKLLRESIELYGCMMRDNNSIKFYHGIVGELVFPTTIAKFCPPTSFTTSLSVASTFSGGGSTNGIILSLEIYGLDVSYFDCRWLSNYSNEQERVVCGGYQCFIIRNIMLIRLQHSYKQYLKAINIILSCINTKFNPEKNINKKTVKIIRALINYFILPSKPNPFQIPEYILKLWQCIRINYNKEIKISLPQLRDKNYYKPLKKLFIHNNGDNEKWINLDIICKLFCQCPRITICGNYGNDGILLSNETFDFLYNFFKNIVNKSQFIQLNQVIFESPNESLLTARNAISFWKKMFKDQLFIMQMDTNSEGISSIIFNKTDIINETIIN